VARPKSLLSRFRRVSQYDPSFSSASSSHNEVDGGEGDQGRERERGSLITIPTLGRMRELDRCEVDVDWEKVKTLPRVCLIPPEGMSSPVGSDSKRLYFTPVLLLLLTM
jgi:hypothetical protein